MNATRHIFVAALSATVICGALHADDDPFLSAETQQLRFREAFSYAYKEDQRGIEVGVEVFGKKEQRRLFGDKVGDYATLDVAITNNSPFRLHLSDFEVFNAGEKKPLVKDDLNEVVEDIDPGGGGNKDHMRMAILRSALAEKALQNVIIEPGATVQGVVFVREGKLDKKAELFVRLQNLKRLAFLEYRIPFRSK